MPTPSEREIYSVSQLNRAARQSLERDFGVVWVQGELSNLSLPASGHWYFTLKDQQAQVRCAMFRARNALLGFQPHAGQQVLARGRISLYEPRGDYQLIVEHLEDDGLGALQREFERLKQKLAAEGLFATDSKRSLPRLPRRIGIITSTSGAALRDILQVLRRRFASANVLIYPTSVQGANAVPEILTALQLASTRREVDVLILSRGGGSIEDLWAFNDEQVARAIRACPIPVITGIGHEIDFTIADFAADVRAPTPSAAAEMAAPDTRAFLETLERSAQRLCRAIQRELQQFQALLNSAKTQLRLAHPGNRLMQQTQRLDELDLRMRAAVQQRLLAAQHRLSLAMRTLHTVSPLATLGRGFAVICKLPQGEVITQTSRLSSGDEVLAKLADGEFEAQVIRVK
jgi:exodeoxyribonuclease VII large subunit